MLSRSYAAQFGTASQTRGRSASAGGFVPASHAHLMATSMPVQANRRRTAAARGASQPKRQQPQQPPQPKPITVAAAVAANRHVPREVTVVAALDPLAHGVPDDLSKHKLPWPLPGVGAVVISLRAKRWQNMQERLGQWKTDVTLQPAVHGQTLTQEWRIKHCTVKGAALKSGELGCYQSHIAAWSAFDADKSAGDYMLVLEDDSRLVGNRLTRRLIDRAWREIRAFDPQVQMWHISSVPWLTQAPHPTMKFNRISHCCQGFVAYLVSRSAVEILLSHAYPIDVPIDVLPYILRNKGILTHIYTCYPSIAWQVEASNSDTSALSAGMNEAPESTSE